MKDVKYDLVIIGGGPAGLTAGLYAARGRLHTLLVEKVSPGGQVLITDWIENYPGYPEGISGPDLIDKMTEQVKRFDLKIESGEVVSLDVTDSIKKIVLSDRTITAHAVIIASGATPKKLGVPGEDIFFGRGVSSCATCDGPFFKDGVLAAVGGGDTAVQESLYLTKFAKKVYLIHRRDQLRAEAILQERALANDKIEILWDTVLSRIDGLSNVEEITVEHVKTGEKTAISVDGCFIWVGIQPITDFLPDTVAVDSYGFIEANADMSTSVPGIFVAGDARNTPLRQIATAVGDAAIAAFSAENYIETVKNEA
ncbi:MAG: thioredoxin-disulfide reductase [Desulfobacterales bacterium]